MRKSLMLISCFLVTVMGYSQEAVNVDPPAVPESFQAVETPDIITVDGRLTETA